MVRSTISLFKNGADYKVGKLENRICNSRREFHYVCILNESHKPHNWEEEGCIRPKNPARDWRPAYQKARAQTGWILLLVVLGRNMTSLINGHRLAVLKHNGRLFQGRKNYTILFWHLARPCLVEIYYDVPQFQMACSIVRESCFLLLKSRTCEANNPNSELHSFINYQVDLGLRSWPTGLLPH